MDNLKLAALTVLIPFGWLISEAAACPRPAEMIDAIGFELDLIHTDQAPASR